MLLGLLYVQHDTVFGQGTLFNCSHGKKCLTSFNIVANNLLKLESFEILMSSF